MRESMKNNFRKLRLSQLDRSLSAAKNFPPRPSDGWLASLREALGISQVELGKRAHLAKQGVQRFERAEAADSITLGNLRKLAEAMGCDLTYVLTPKSGTLAELADRSARDSAAHDVARVMQTMALEDQKPENAEQFIEDETQRRLKP
jgi:predicted DNA-binding mobile mystery protein A